MLFRGSRRAYYFPALFLGVAALISAVFLADLAGSQPGALMRVLLGAGCLYFAAASCRVLSVKGGALWVRGLHERRCLELDACAFGVRLEQRFRRPRVYVVFVTDSVVSEPIGEWSRESAARSAVARLDALVGPPAMNPRRELARRQVAQIEQEWQARVSNAEKTWAAYYQSKSWRSAKYAAISAVLLCLLAIGLYLSLRER